MNVTKLIKNAALCVVTKGALFFLFSLWLSSSEPLKVWFISRGALFFHEHVFGVSRATICFHYESGTMWNQLFFNKTKNVNDLKCVCLYAFTGCQLPLLCSTAPQCEAAAAVTDLAGLFLCKAAAPLVVGHGSYATFQLNNGRWRQVQVERAWVILHCVLQCQWHMCACVCLCVHVWFVVVVKWSGMTFLSHHTTLCVFPMFVSASLESCICGTTHPSSVCTYLTRSVYETVCMICKCQWKWHTNGDSEEDHIKWQ